VHGNYTGRIRPTGPRPSGLWGVTKPFDDGSGSAPQTEGLTLKWPEASEAPPPEQLPESPDRECR